LGPDERNDGQVQVDVSNVTGGKSTKIVLGVDDVPQNLMLLDAVLGAAGYTFLSVASGRECLTMLTRVTPRLILLDIQMPEMDGLETCRRIRAIRELAQVPVAFLTASKSAEDVRAGLAAGGNDFIVKPFDIQKLLLRVEHWTTRRIAVASSWDIAGR
jgi:two-component system, OmpR family, response regulator